jgi:hypothetical protein
LPHQFVVLDSIEKFLQIEIDDPTIAVRDVMLRLAFNSCKASETAATRGWRLQRFVRQPPHRNPSLPLLKAATLLQFGTAAIQGQLLWRQSATGCGVSGMVEMEEDRQEDGCATPCED